VKPRRGLTLVLTLWLVVVLVAMVYSLMWDIQVEIRLRDLSNDALDARWAAQAGVAKAVADLANDMVIERSEDSTTTPLDTLGDVWALDNEDKVDISLSPLEGSRGRSRVRRSRRREQSETPESVFTVTVVDAESRINLNRASVELLTSLLIVLDEDLEKDEQAKRLAEAIIDWRDENTDPVSPLAEPGFQERRHFMQTLHDEDDIEWTGVMHNARFVSVDELLEVPGMTRELFYGPGDEEDGDGGRRSRRSRSRTRRGQEDEIVGLADCVTVASNGQININTAPRLVLGALMLTALGTGGDWESAADGIIEYRNGRRSGDASDDTPFTSVQDLANVPVAAILSTRGQAMNLGTRSQNFVIESMGRAGSARHSIVCEVQRSWEVYVRDYATLAQSRAGGASGLTAQIQQFMADEAERAERGRRDRSDTRRRANDDPRVETPAVRILTWAEN
jgi:type II secretory pathway component PulK